jgi:transposase
VDKASGVAEIERKKHMPRTHKPYDADFRQQAVELLLSSGKTQREVARDLGICMETLRDWKQRQEQKPAKARRWIWNVKISACARNWLTSNANAKS